MLGLPRSDKGWCLEVYPMTYILSKSKVTITRGMAIFARRRPFLPSFLSLVTVTKVLRYFNVVLFLCRYQAHIANQAVNFFHKWSLLDVTSDKARLCQVFHRELSIILSYVSVTSNDR